jgi:hypothetical protein
MNELAKSVWINPDLTWKETETSLRKIGYKLRIHEDRVYAMSKWDTKAEPISTKVRKRPNDDSDRITYQAYCKYKLGHRFFIHSKFIIVLILFPLLPVLIEFFITIRFSDVTNIQRIYYYSASFGASLTVFTAIQDSRKFINQSWRTTINLSLLILIVIASSCYVMFESNNVPRSLNQIMPSIMGLDGNKLISGTLFIFSIALFMIHENVAFSAKSNK